ncbi:MAG: CDP-alcohol phosphatidyltransferase family protein [Saprospiraceae bacterium]|nr:CDP-alcohol phosphatidyltransferase family protein [Saprospiraceae bacterium]
MGKPVKEDTMAIRSWATPLAWLILGMSPLFIYSWGSDLLFVSIGVYFGILLYKTSHIWAKTRGRLWTNSITIFRVILILGAGLSWNHFPAVPLAVLLWCAAILDGVDGWVARKMKGETIFGGFFDEESDALFVFVACFLIWKTEMGGWWILTAGWIRYVVILVKHNYPPAKEVALRMPWARTLAGLSFVFLPLCLIIGGPVGLGIQWVILCSILYSFTRELILLYGP